MAQGTWRVDPEVNARLQQRHKVDQLDRTHLPEGVVPLQHKDGSVTYNYEGREYATLSDVPAPSWGWLNTAGEKVQQFASQLPYAQQVAQGLKIAGDITTMPGEEGFAHLSGKSAQMWGVPYNIGKTMGYLAYPGPGELKALKGVPPLKPPPTGLVPALAGVPSSVSKGVDTAIDVGKDKPLEIRGNYSGKTSTGFKPAKAGVRDFTWLPEQRKKVELAIKKGKFDRAYNWLSTWAPWDKNIYQTSAAIAGRKQHHKFPKYASSAFVLRMMELVQEGKADLDDVLHLHSLSYHYSLPMGGGRWGIQDVLSVPHDQGHVFARLMDWEHKGKPFQKISSELLALDTPEEVAHALVEFIQTKGKPSLEAMLKLEEEYSLTFRRLTPEDLRAMKIKQLTEELKNPKQ